MTTSAHTPAPRRVVAYLRVSSNGQVENGHGLDSQEHACRERAKAIGATIVAVLREEGVKGTEAERKALTEAMAMVENGEADAIMVSRLDRLARDLILQEVYIREIAARGGVLLSSSASEDEVLQDDTADPGRKMVRQIMGAVAEYDRAMVVMRLATGRATKRRQGTQQIEGGDFDSYKRGKGSGSYPFGYDKDGRVDREQTVLAVITAGLSAGQTKAEISAHLNTLPDHEPRNAEQWTPRSVGHVITKAKLT
jgi:DNA invertase Pin-like site-specific DNA recombinase